MGWRLARWCLLGALGCGIAGSAWAEPLSPAVEERIKKLRQEARSLFDKGQPEAIERQRAVWELSTASIDLCNLGKMQLTFRREREAAATLLKCLVLITPLKNQASLRKNVERDLQFLRAQLGRFEVEGNVVNVVGAELLIDGEMIGALPLEGPIFVDPGWRNVEVRAPGFRSDIKRVEARPGTAVRLKMHLEALKPEIVTASKPEGVRGSGEQPPAAARGSLRMGAAAPQEKRSLRTGPLVTGIALSAVGVAIGIGGALVAKAAHAAADAAGRKLDATGHQDPCSAPVYRDLCKEYRRELDAIAPFTALGIGGFVLLGVGGALITIEITRAGSNKAKNGPGPAFIVTPSGNGLIVGGSF